MQQYLNLMRFVLDHGFDKRDRTGTGTKSIFGYQLRFDLAEGFPAVTTKKLHMKSIIYELLWFLRGDTNVRYLRDNGVAIWDQWANDEGELGPVYGAQWRSWPTPEGRHIDQISQVLQEIKQNPDSRRLFVSAWNVAELERMALPPCHAFFQFYVADNRLSCQLYQRSADIFLGLPFNIASYSLLTMMVAQVTGLRPGEFIHTLGDAHVYVNHFEQAHAQLARTPRPLPHMQLNPDRTSLFEFDYNDFTLLGYDPHPASIEDTATQPPVNRSGCDVRTMLIRFANGLPSDSQVFRPMSIWWPVVRSRKCLRSAGKCQGRALSMPTTPFSAMATIKQILGVGNGSSDEWSLY